MWTRNLIFAFSLLIPCIASAGQSIDLTSSGPGSFNTTGADITGSWRVEWQISDLDYAASIPLRLNAIGGYFQWVTSNGKPRLDFWDQNSTISPTSILCNVHDKTNFTVRVQRDLDTMITSIETWNTDGTGYSVCTVPITSFTSGSTNHFSSLGAMRGKVGFLRVSTTTVPLNSRPPVTFETGDWAEWKFDGNGVDSSINGNVTIPTDGFDFVDTPDQLVVSIPAVPNTPYWANYRPLRAGHVNSFASNSYSMADDSADVTCLWQQISGPSTLIWDDKRSCTPSVDGVVFGPYVVRLQVEDLLGTKAVSDFNVGAVAYDDNGVVIYPDERIESILGPQIVRGMGPWGYSDLVQYELTTERAMLFDVNGGEVQLPNKKPDLNGIPLTGTIWWDSTYSGNRHEYGIGTNFMEIYCGGVPGPATGSWLVPQMRSPLWGGDTGTIRPLSNYVRSCVSDTEIIADPWLESEQSVTVSSPGVSWGVWDHGQYPSLRTGTVYVENSSTTLYGIGTDFQNVFCDGGTTRVTSAGIMIPGAKLTVIDATNATPIVVSLSSDHGLADGAEITILGVGGNTAANGTYYAKVVSDSSVSLYKNSTLGTALAGDGDYTSGGTLQSGMKTYTVSSCVSSTEIVISPAYSGVSIESPGETWVPRKSGPALGTWSTGLSWNVPFYDTALAYYREYYRSGDIRARNAARYMAANQYQNPYYAQTTRLYEPAVSPIFAAVIEPEIFDGDPWPMIVHRASQYGISTSFPSDQRESSYAVWTKSFIAQYHPDADVRAAHRTELIDHYNNRAVPLRFANGGYYSLYDTRGDNASANNPLKAKHVWQVETGSTTATLVYGADIDDTYCGTEMNGGGTASVDETGLILTGTGTDWVGTAGEDVILLGTLNGEPHVEVSRIKSTVIPTASSATLSFKWRGDTGDLVKVHIHSSGFPIQYLESVDADGDSQTPMRLDTEDIYYCTYVSPTEIELYPPYKGDSGDGDVYRRLRSGSSYVFAAAFRQPFMDGLRGQAYAEAARALATDEPEISAGYWTIVGELADLLYTGRNTVTNGQEYFDAPICRPVNYAVNGSVCGMASIGSSRDLSLETVGVFSQAYLNSASPDVKTAGDEMYRYLYARTGYDAPVEGDGYIAEYETSDKPNTALGGARDKALGQSFGHGGGSLWPAARLGGPAPESLRSHSVSFSLPVGAEDVKYETMTAQGSTVETVCTASPCAVSVDRRAGRVRARWSFRDGSQKTVARSNWTEWL